MNWIEQLDKLDKQLSLFLNGFHHPLLDELMWYISLKYTWIPLYALMVYMLWKWFGKGFWKMVLAVLIAVALADQFASALCKPFFERLRPSHSPEISHLVHILRDYRGGKYGFISSHASTSFAVAFFFFLILKPLRRRKSIGYAWLFWAALVSYSRVYLGVHYLGDILFGTLAGVLIAWSVFVVYRRFAQV